MTIDAPDTCDVRVEVIPRGSEVSGSPPLFVTYREAARLEGIAYKSVTKRVCSGRYRAVAISQHRRRDQPRAGILFRDLCSRGKARWLAEHGLKVTRPRPAPTAAASEPEAGTPARAPAGLATVNGDGVPVLISDPRVVWEPGLLRVRSRFAIEQFEFRRRAVLALKDAQAGRPYGHAGDVALEVAHDLHVACGSLLNWQSTWRRHGEPGLVPRNKGRRGSRTIPRVLASQIESFYAQGAGSTDRVPPTLQECHDYAVRWCKAKMQDTGQIVRFPSIYAVRRVVNALWAAKPMLLDCARQGRDHFRNVYSARVTRDPEAIPLGALWCLDHRVFDFHVIGEDGKLCRAWLSAIEDIHSGDLVGYSIRRKPSSESVASAYRMAILGRNILDPATGEIYLFPPRGTPKYTLQDGGREFKGGVFAEKFNPKTFQLDPDVDSTFHEALGIERHVALPRAPQSKGIEALFSSLARRIERYFPGYCGATTDEKPEQLALRRDRGELLHWNQFQIGFARALCEWRAERPLGHYRHLPPIEYWAGFTPPPIDPARLDRLLTRKDAIRFGNKGIEIEHNGTRLHYASDDVRFAAMTGQKVPILWTADDPDFAIAVTPLGERLLLLRVDLLEKSWDLLLGREMPEEHRIMKRLAGHQAALLAAYRQACAAHRDPALSDRFDMLRTAAANGIEIRGIERQLLTDSDAPAARPRRRPIPSAPSTPPAPRSETRTRFGSYVVDALRAERAAEEQEAVASDQPTEPVPTDSPGDAHASVRIFAQVRANQAAQAVAEADARPRHSAEFRAKLGYTSRMLLAEKQEADEDYFAEAESRRDSCQETVGSPSSTERWLARAVARDAAFGGEARDKEAEDPIANDPAYRDAAARVERETEQYAAIVSGRKALGS